MIRSQDEERFLWFVRRVDNLSLFGAFMSALGGMGGGNAASEVNGVRADPDGLLVMEGSVRTAARWLPWDSVMALVPVDPQANAAETWLELRVDDGLPLRLGPKHIETDLATKEGAEEAWRKTSQVVSAWEAWRRERGISRPE